MLLSSFSLLMIGERDNFLVGIVVPQVVIVGDMKKAPKDNFLGLKYYILAGEPRVTISKHKRVNFIRGKIHFINIHLHISRDILTSDFPQT